MTRPRLASLLSTCLALSGCAQIDGGATAMGPGSETSGLQVRLVNAKGEPARKVEVKAVAVDGWSSQAPNGMPVVARRTTDDSGRVDFEGLPRIALSLEADLGSAVVRQLVPAGDVSPRTLTLRNGGMMLLRLQGDTVGLQKVLLAGTAWEARRQGDGCWVFPWIPQGRYQAMGLRQGAVFPLALLTADSARSVDTTLRVRVSTFLDDFEAPSRQNIFGLRLGGGNWFAVSQGQATSRPPVSDPQLLSAREPGWQGNSLHVQLQVDSVAIGSSVALLGMDFATAAAGRTDVPRDLSGLDSLVFLARGRGEIEVRLLGVDSCHFGATLRLPDAWTRLALPVSAFQAASTCPTATRDLRRIGGLGFAARADAELWLDNLELVGISPLALFPELR